MKELFFEFTPGFVLSLEVDLKQNCNTIFVKTFDKEDGPGGFIVEKMLTKTPIDTTINSQDMKEVLEYVKLSDSVLSKFDKKEIKLDISKALDEIKKQYRLFMNDIGDYREKEKQAEDELLQEMFEEKSSDFMSFLEENELTLFGYLEYLARWFSGGEAKNTLIGFLCHYGTFSGTKPLWFMALGKAGEGKSFIEEASLKLVPSKYIENGLKTPAALIRKGQMSGLDYLDRKILTMGDMGDPKDYEDYRRVMHKYKKMTTEGHDEFEAVADNPDPITGERQTILMELKGYPSVCFTSVNSENVDDQFLSRGLTVTPEASDKQVAMFVRYMQSGSLWKQKSDYIVRNQLPMLHAYLQKIEGEDLITDVINPYYYCLEEWFSGDEYFKRALTKYPELVKIVTYLNREQREFIAHDNIIFYIATKEDNMTVAQLLNPNSNLSGVAIKVFNQLLKYYKPYDEDEYETYRIEDTNLKNLDTIFSVNSAKTHLRNTREFRGLNYGEIFYNLQEAGLISSPGKVPRSRNNIYCLERTEEYGMKEIVFDQKLIDEYVDEVQFIYGPTPGEIREKISQEKSSNYSENPYGKLKPAPWF